MVSSMLKSKLKFDHKLFLCIFNHLPFFLDGEEEFISTAESILMDAAVEYQAATAQNPGTEPLCFMYEATEVMQLSNIL